MYYIYYIIKNKMIFLFVRHFNYINKQYEDNRY